jgi:hypothetical protein
MKFPNINPQVLQQTSQRFRRKWRELRHVADRRALMMSIEVLHEAAVEHECLGVPHGDPVLHELYRKAVKYCSEYASRWNESLADLHVLVPKLEHLRKLARSE